MNRKPAVTYRVRSLTPRDYDAVLALWRATPGIGLDPVSDSRAAITRYLKRNPRLSFVAEIQGTLVGAVLSGHDGRRGYLHHLAVAAPYRRLGIGRALAARCLRGLARQGIPKCNLFLFRSNASGHSFWKYNGWKNRQDLALFQKTTTA